MTGETQRNVAPTRINRRQFEVCFCAQMVRELKSGDVCVTGSDAYWDHRDELVPMEECERTRADYGEKVGIPVNRTEFVPHVHTLLTQAAQQADQGYLANSHFNIIDGRPKLDRYQKKALPTGFKELDDALRRKLDRLELSLLDVLADTMQWLGWGKHFGPLSGHQGKLHDEDRRKILTVFAYGTGIGSTQIAKNIAGVSARQVSFVNQRQVTTEKLEAAISTAINGYNQFQLPQYWGGHQAGRRRRHAMEPVRKQFTVGEAYSLRRIRRHCLLSRQRHLHCAVFTLHSLWCLEGRVYPRRAHQEHV